MALLANDSHYLSAHYAHVMEPDFDIVSVRAEERQRARGANTRPVSQTRAELFCTTRCCSLVPNQRAEEQQLPGNLQWSLVAQNLVILSHRAWNKHLSARFQNPRFL